MSITAPTIAECQQLLIAAGYDVGPDGADGHFGANTKTALLKFQVARGLSATGIFDQPTTTALFYPKETPQMNTVIAEVKSAWVSKVNWTLAITFLLNALAFFGIAIPADVKDAVMMIVTSLGIVIAWVIKTWFTTSISAASAAKISP